MYHGSDYRAAYILIQVDMVIFPIIWALSKKSDIVNDRRLQGRLPF